MLNMEMQIKTTISYHYTYTTVDISVGKNVEKLDPAYIAGGNIKWCTHSGQQSSSFWKHETELPYNPAVPLLIIYSRKIETYVHRKTVYSSS